VTNSQHSGKCKDTYGQTIKQSRKTKTEDELPQTKKRGGQIKVPAEDQSLNQPDPKKPPNRVAFSFGTEQVILL